MPHSEICGSKVAHTSPQLIAACHVLHRLCMPRHPPNALTSRLRVHTTNGNADAKPLEACGSISQPFISVRIASSPAHAEARPTEPDAGPRHRFRKNPFTMSKMAARPRADGLAHVAATAAARGNRCLILDAGGAYRDRTDDLKLAKLALSQLS